MVDQALMQYAVLGAGVVLVLAALIVMAVVLHKAQALYARQVRTLQALIKARTLNEFAAAEQQSSTTPKQELRKLELENDLAREAERITQTNAAHVRTS